VLGNPDGPHTVTYIEDFARALVTLGEQEESLGQVWHVPNADTVTMRSFVQLAFEAAGYPARVRAAPRWGIAMAALFAPTMRAVKEQLYQSERPWMVDSSKFEGRSAGPPRRRKPSPRRSPGSRSRRALTDRYLVRSGTPGTWIVNLRMGVG
jgi:hypothetical protein